MAKNKILSASKLFGVSDKEAKKLLDQFREVTQSSDTMNQIARKMGLLKSGKLCYAAYLFGRQVQRNETKGQGVSAIVQLRELLANQQ